MFLSPFEEDEIREVLFAVKICSLIGQSVLYVFGEYGFEVEHEGLEISSVED